ncbi:MAG TPA: hypothetical protein VEB67_02410 [Nitrososphaerales archaeon]|nr:hypothetical protein [Nitrososphaerales archaeon]
MLTPTVTSERVEIDAPVPMRGGPSRLYIERIAVPPVVLAAKARPATAKDSFLPL